MAQPNPKLLLDYKILNYGDDSLQRVAIYTRPQSTTNQSPSIPTSSHKNHKWLIFIHGGAWRDPNNDHHDGEHIISNLLLTSRPDDGTTSHDLYACASIDYPLCNSTKDPSFYALNALKALTLIAQTYPLDEYVLVGHSAGAHIALQTFMYGRQDPQTLKLTQKCYKVFGIEGIYVLDLLVVENKGYAGFVEEAFGSNVNGAWDEASPFSSSISASGSSTQSLSECQKYQWTTETSQYTYTAGSTVVPFSNGTLYICYSPTDELLLEEYQPKLTREILSSVAAASGSNGGNPINFKYCKITGLHEEAIRTKEIIQVIKDNM